MGEVNVSEDIVPLGEFKARAAQFLRRLKGSRQPLVITQNGRPAGVLLSAVEFDRLRERQRFLESVAAGIADADAGQVLDSAALRKALAKRRTRDSAP
ncbi:MAG TPA: type II toxin-antitoxin system Phd/YefM family antitoxin [bacterium]|jgi:prevent-host-death family protein